MIIIANIVYVLLDVDLQHLNLIKSFDIFICGNQNLKSKNIHITKSTKKDNVGYREIIDIKNIKNELEEKKVKGIILIQLMDNM